jgi:hypothetical protein
MLRAVRLSDAPRFYVYADHNPPHFHVEGAGWALCYDLRDFSLYAGDERSAPKALREHALAWARANEGTLWDLWRRINEREG